MATYSELAGIAQNAGFPALRDKVMVSCVVKAVALMELSTPSAAQIAWAKMAIDSPAAAADGVIWYVIGANESATLAQILSASDAAVQANVNAAADVIIGASA